MGGPFLLGGGRLCLDLLTQGDPVQLRAGFWAWALIRAGIWGGQPSVDAGAGDLKTAGGFSFAPASADKVNNSLA